MYRTIVMGTYPGLDGLFCQYVSYWKQDSDTGKVLSHRTYPNPSEGAMKKLTDVLSNLDVRVTLDSRGWTARIDEKVS